MSKHFNPLGDHDGRIDAMINPYNCDPRGAFIRQRILPESAWELYRDSYLEAFTKVCRG